MTRARTLLVAGALGMAAALIVSCMPNIPKLRNPGAFRGKTVYAEVLGEDSEDFQRSLKELALENRDLKVVDQNGEITLRVNVTEKKKHSNPQKWFCGYTAKYEVLDKAGKAITSGNKKVEYESPAEPIVCSAARLYLWTLILGTAGDELESAGKPKPAAAPAPAAAPPTPQLQLTPPSVIREGDGGAAPAADGGAR